MARVFKLIERTDKLREKFSRPFHGTSGICTTDKDKEFTDKLTRIVEEQLENPDFTVDDFASMMALGRTIFYRKVKGVTGYAPKEYLRVMRMKKAAELLLKTDVTVAEVAYQVGINDPSISASASRHSSAYLLRLIRRIRTVCHRLDGSRWMVYTVCSGIAIWIIAMCLFFRLFGNGYCNTFRRYLL